MSEDNVIKSEESLKLAFRREVQDEHLGWIGRHGASVSESAGRIRLALDNRVVLFERAFYLDPGRREIERLANEQKSIPILLVVVRLTQATVRHCRDLGLSCVDLNGLAWIRADGILIDATFTAGRNREKYTLERKEPDLFSLKSGRLSRALLSFPGRAWKQSDLVDTTGLAAGLVSRLLNHLVHVGWATGDRGDWRLTKPDALLDAWRSSDKWSKRVSIREYATLERDTRAIARRLADFPKHRLAFTQWFAAGLRYPYANVSIVSAYRDVFPEEDELAKLSLTRVQTGGQVWLLVPKDEGVYQVGRLVEGFPLVSDVQIYLDLLQVGLRGPDQAKALREWHGFCK